MLVEDPEKDRPGFFWEVGVISRLNTEQSVGRSVQGFGGHHIFSVLLKGKVDENILVACNPAWFVGRCLL